MKNRVKTETPLTGVSSVSNDEPEPCRAVRWEREDASDWANAAGLAASRHKKAGPEMEPASYRETTMKAARLPSGDLPQSLEAAKLSIVLLSTTLANW